LQSTSAKNLVGDQSGLVFAKSPKWVGQKLLFLDTHDRCIKSADLSGTVQIVTTLSFLPGSFDILEEEGLMVSDAWRRIIYRLEDAGQKMVADISDIARTCLNDGIVDQRGGMYVNDVGFNFLDPLVDPVADGVIVYISPTGISSVVAGGIFTPGGMIVTPDNSTLIVAETLGHRLTAFEIDRDGSLRNRRVWAQFGDGVNPDGICLDQEGAIWVAGAGLSALHVREGGEVDKQITTSRPVIATMLGGPERKHLFICTSASRDPVITRQATSAAIDIAEVETPGVVCPADRVLVDAPTIVSAGPGVRNAL
jgi:sugar lactone lactonase YvrE